MLRILLNGASLETGRTRMAGDAGDVVRPGSPPWQLVMFGVVVTALGPFLRHRLGSRVGTAGHIPEKREGPAPS